MITFLRNVFKKGELRQKITFTLGILFVYRLGSSITIPSVSASALGDIGTTGIFAIMDMIGGGTLSSFSIFALGVSPYITSSIIIELLSMDVIPVLTEWRKEGNTGKKKKDRVTRFVTLALAALQAGMLTYAFDKGYGILTDSTIWTYAYVTIVMVAGTMLAVWFGDQITNKGIGNGVSLLIFTGIVSSLPNNFISTFSDLVDFTGTTSAIALGFAQYALFVLLYLAIIVFVVFAEGSIRKIPVVYAGSTSNKMHAKPTQHMPIKINSAGVIPVIFASSVLAAPRTVVSFMETTDITTAIDTIFDYSQPIGFVLYLLMIVGFTFFYANLQIDTDKISKDLKKNNGAIPAVRTGEETRIYLYKVLNRITVLGAAFLVLVAAIPLVTPLLWTSTADSSLSLGGTGLIIVTGVALETVRQIKAQITRKEYHGYIRK
ncbi:preprotein translocase subunit SecY [Tannockella kyphosi]|uniref:preprotein translocase subunit SecY n=1 Tax=Tannockella kyphosi TaxID=2899121 RepID=UPI002010E835|nr:preprotein translocase subunit SecY [Tannockella kyphosi]